jgi:hypothetical protein
VQLGDLEERVARNPYGMVAAAIGVGFVLGGGLFTRLTGRMVGVGVRIGLTSALPFLTEALLKAATETASSAPVIANREGKSA